MKGPRVAPSDLRLAYCCGREHHPLLPSLPSLLPYTSSPFQQKTAGWRLGWLELVWQFYIASHVCFRKGICQLPKAQGRKVIYKANSPTRIVRSPLFKKQSKGQWVFPLWVWEAYPLVLSSGTWYCSDGHRMQDFSQREATIHIQTIIDWC